jgi:hypothetical protein
MKERHCGSIEENRADYYAQDGRNNQATAPDY